MKLRESLKRFDSDVLIHLGSGSGYVDIAPVSKMLQEGYLESLSQKHIRELYEKADDEKISAFKPFEDREVKEVYPLSRPGCVAVIVTGNENGKYWCAEEKGYFKEPEIYIHVENVAMPIVRQAATDYFNLIAGFSKEDTLSNKESLERFFHSSWYDTLTDLDPNYLMKKIKGGSRKDGVGIYGIEGARKQQILCA